MNEEFFCIDCEKVEVDSEYGTCDECHERNTEHLANLKALRGDKNWQATVENMQALHALGDSLGTGRYAEEIKLRGFMAAFFPDLPEERIRKMVRQD